MAEDLEPIVALLFKNAYGKVRGEEEYHQSFADEGVRKAQYIVDDLVEREYAGQLVTSELGYLSIGGSDGSELFHVMTSTNLSRGVLLEIGDDAVARAAATQSDLAARGKELEIIHGDAVARLDDALTVLEDWRDEGVVSGLVCSAQAVLHELPTRSQGFSLPTFLGRLYRDPAWKACLFYSREPSVPAGWPEQVRIRTPYLPNEQLVRAALFVRDRLGMSGEPLALASNWVSLPAPLAVETLQKLCRGSSLRRIEYELGEQLTGFDALEAKQHLESLVEGMKVTVDQITTLGFKKALRSFEVEYVGSQSECLPIPRTHAEIRGVLYRDAEPLQRKSRVFDREGTEAVTSPPGPESFNNPFQGTIGEEEISRWLQQFEPDERSLIARLVGGFTYVSSRRLQDLVRELKELIDERLGPSGADAVFVPMGGPGKSGGFISYVFRVQNRIEAEQFMDLPSLAEQHALPGPIVLLDDLVATGHQAAAEWSRFSEGIPGPPDRRVLLATIVSHEAGRRFVEERSEIEVCSTLELTVRDEPLSPTSSLFEVEAERNQLRRILSKYGQRLAEKHPFGYGGSGLLLAFEHSTPDNTFPIFWSSRAGWQPLLLRSGSGRMFTD